MYRNYGIKEEIDLLEPRNLPSQGLGSFTPRSTVGLLLREPSPIRRRQLDLVVLGRAVSIRDDGSTHRFLKMRRGGGG